jgi:hypothetical protein
MNELYGLIGLAYAVFAVLAVRNFFICRRRSQKLEELRRYIKDITDPKGCSTIIDPRTMKSWAMMLYEECRHISDHYKIPLSEAGFDGDIEDLFAETGGSLTRYGQREKEVLSTAIRV